MAGAPERSHYEEAREENVRRNKEFMRSMGLLDDAEALRSASKRPKQDRPQRSLRKPVLPSRSSARNEGKVVKYTFDLSDRALGLSRGSRPRGPGSVVWDNTQVPDPAKAEAATARAAEYAKKSQLPNCVKQLLKSHISGGFWLQLPTAFCAHMPDTILSSTPQVLFDLEGYSGDAMPLEVPDGDVWEVIWLPKGSDGGGLSGGWRGFSLDNNLAFGDTIVFEKLDGHRLRGTIFRAVPLTENTDYQARDPALVAKVEAQVAAAREKGGKRRYSAMTIRVNEQRKAIAAAAATGQPYRTASRAKIGSKGSPKQPWSKVVARVNAEEDTTTLSEGGEENEYAVERLLDTRKRKGVREYHVKWDGWDDPADNTWEVAGNLNDALQDYQGFMTNVWPKLSKAEQSAIEKEKGNHKAAKKAMAKNTRRKGQQADGRINGKGKANAKEKSVPAPNIPSVGDRIEVNFGTYYIGTVKQIRQKGSKQPKPGRGATKATKRAAWEFLVVFDADGELWWVSQGGPWRPVAVAPKSN